MAVDESPPHDTICFDIHGFVTLRLERPPTHVADHFVAELPAELTGRDVQNPDIVLLQSSIIGPQSTYHVGAGRVVVQNHDDSAICLNKVVWSLRQDIRRKVTLEYMSGVDVGWLWYITEQFIKLKLQQRGLNLIHAAAFEANGQIIAVSGWSQSGKTTLLLEALKHGHGYLADDYLIVSPEAKAFSYAPSRISLNVFQARQLDGRHLEENNLVSRSLSRITNPTLSRYFLKRFFPSAYSWATFRAGSSRKYVYLSEHLPRLRRPRKGQLAKVIILIKYSGDHFSFIRSNLDEAVRMVVQNTTWDFRGFENILEMCRFMQEPDEAADEFFGQYRSRLASTVRESFSQVDDFFKILIPDVTSNYGFEQLLHQLLHTL